MSHSSEQVLNEHTPEEIIEIELTDDETEQLKNSAGAVEELVEALARV